MVPVARHDPSSLEALAVRSAKAHRLALALARDAHGAEDLAQDALLALLRRPPATTEAVGSWLVATMRNLLRLRDRGDVRRRQREQTVARSELDSTAQQALEHLELHEALFRAVRELREPYRTTVLLRWFEDLEPLEIARRTGVPVRTVHTRVTRALTILRSKLQRGGAGTANSGWGAILPLAVLAQTWKGTCMAKTSTKLVAGAIAVTVASATVAVIYPSLIRGPDKPETASTTSSQAPAATAGRSEGANRVGVQPESESESAIPLASSQPGSSTQDEAQEGPSALEGARTANMLEVAVGSFLTASPDLGSFEAGLESLARISKVDPSSVQENPRDGSITGSLAVPGVEAQLSFRIQGHQYELSLEPSPGNPLPPPFGWRDIKVKFLEESGAPKEIQAWVQYNPVLGKHAIDSVPAGEERYAGWNFTIGPDETRGLPTSIQRTPDGAGWRIGNPVGLPEIGGQWPYHSALYEGWLAKLKPYAP